MGSIERKRDDIDVSDLIDGDAMRAGVAGFRTPVTEEEALRE